MRTRWIVMGLWIALPLGAQQPAAPPSGTIRGTIIDATTSQPLGGATVILGASDGLSAFPPAPGSSWAAAARTSVTRATGAYVFTDLSSGRYRLYVQRVGYEPVVLDVELRGAATSEVSVGLVVLPVRLRAVRVQGTSAAPVTTFVSSADIDGETRVAAARQRQREYLGSDVRELTNADVTEAATLGAADLFRALRRLPGVAGYDDWSPQLWVRGGTWNETAVLFDGLPLYQPMHALGTLSGVGTDAIGAAFLHPGVRPASLAGEGAAIVDLRSRPGGGNGRVRGEVELSSLGGRVALDQRNPDGRFDWAVSARRSLRDVLPHATEWLGGGFAAETTLHYTEVSARADIGLGAGRAVETTALLSNDYYNSLAENRGAPQVDGGGNLVAKTTFRAPVGGLITAHSVGVSRFRSRDLSTPIPWSADAGVVMSPHRVATPEILDNASDDQWTSIDYVTLGGEVHPRAAGQSVPWSVGYGWTTRRTGLEIPRAAYALSDLSNEARSERAALSYATLYGERRWSYGPRLELDGGVRVDGGGHIANAPVVRPAPSLQARYAFRESAFLSAGVGRSYQYLQTGADASGLNGGSTPGIPLLARRDSPAIVADQANLGVEQWRGNGILLTANAYARRLAGVAERNLPDLEIATQTPFTSSTVRVYGAEVGARKLIGRLTGTINYAITRAEANDGSQHYAASGDRRHLFDATGMFRQGGLRYGAAFTAMTGAPYTRTGVGRLAVDTSRQTLFWLAPPTAQDRNALRLPAFASLDLLLDWTIMMRGIGVMTFAQMENALNRSNLTWYRFTSPCQPTTPPTGCSARDVMFAPVARHSTFGLRLAF